MRKELEKALKRAEESVRNAESSQLVNIFLEQHARARQPQSQPNSVTVTAPTELHFRNCKEVRAAGYSHMHRGQPGYAPHLDRDGDGIACDKHK